MQPLVSIIVPIYDVEKYLKECIESILNQTYKNLEIILVDDESPDNCGKICNDYALMDNRIKVIHKKNGGLSDARNAGLEIMTGEYLMFVDSDDYISNDCVEKLYELSVLHNADLVIGGTEKFDDETKKVIWSTYSGKEEIQLFDKEKSMADMFENGCASWARLYRSEIHKDILFPVGEINEDEAIVLRLLERCNSVVKTNCIIYNYRYRSQSITSTKWSIKKLDWVNHCKNNYEYIMKNHKSISIYAKKRYISSLMWALNSMTVDPVNLGDRIVVYKYELKQLMKNNDWKFNISVKERFRAWMLVHCYDFYASLVKIFDKHYM